MQDKELDELRKAIFDTSIPVGDRTLYMPELGWVSIRNNVLFVRQEDGAYAPAEQPEIDIYNALAKRLREH